MNIIQTVHSRRGFRAFFDDLKTWRAWETVPSSFVRFGEAVSGSIQSI